MRAAPKLPAASSKWKWLGARRPAYVQGPLPTDWWELVWSDRHQPGAQVWRIEFEIGRTALTELELYDPDAVLAAVPSIWRYCTGEWLTLRTPCPDSNSSRWPVAAPWRSIQAATLAHGATDLAWIRRRKRASSFRRLMPGLVGYLVSFAALSGTFTVADTLEALTAHLAVDEIARRTTFAERVHRRRAEGGIR